ncbi:hypothetical protein PVAND_007913 [Polypedilum vanderplanki]|uniref:Cadherin domain-containing protein n=1 Tax=Polypedilum vanderplanki TaxID=319348 RepID=A0A9J6C8F8_POLVA|nr:hypothetical protein PVAND_007913 [Polypedilum vanderplanki]
MLRTKSLLFLNLLINFSTAEWIEPFFTDLPEYVKMELETFETFTLIKFSMDEELPVPFTMAYLNGYSESTKPVVEFTFSYSHYLGFELFQSNSRWAINITKRQDYENENNQKYGLTMIADSKTVFIDIKINNIFDNKPTIVALDNPCFVDELNEDNYTTDCRFEVTDIDGMVNNTITFKIEGNNNETELFDLVEVERLTQFTNLYALVLKRTLHYEERSIYTFQTIVFDIGGNEFSFYTIVRVNDLPNLPPMWTKIFASAQFNEKQPTDLIFEAKAIDGDTGIDTKICYNLDFEINQDFSNLISINDETGDILVKYIDRDFLKINIFPFNITARKCNEFTSYITSSAVLIVNDINDNAPEISFNDEKNVIRLYEETIEKLFSSRDLIIKDIDLNQNAQYNVYLTPESHAVAFSLVPESGYQEQSFTISVLQPDILDYDRTEDFRDFELMIIATEINEEHSTNKTFRVELINWNDELPSFLQSEYIFEVEETVSVNFLIGNVEAKDDDFGDKIQYYLSDIRINVDLESGQLSTKIDNAFDYEQQQEVIFQVFANDTLQTGKEDEKIHTTSTQVRIIVKDMNDTPPSISLPWKFLSVTENDRFATITDEIYVRDPDTTASLSLIIDWDLSFASGQNVSKSDYVGCVEIETEEISRNELKTTLKVNSSHLIDYEKFQLLFLTITAIDSETVINNNSTNAVLSVTINDENDNTPEFVGNTLTINRSVIEESEADIFIGLIHAIDIDGPGNNEITYSLINKDESTEGWLRINSLTGEISVNASKIIDCDTPRREYLEYIVHLTDGLNENEGEIAIRIIDTNNKSPQILEFNNIVRIYENASDISLTTVLTHDEDRDEPHNLILYTIDTKSNPELQRYFEINENSGELRVKVLDEFNELDRDTEPSTYLVIIDVADNMGIGIHNKNSTSVSVILLDINDNAPQMPETLNFFSPINETFNENDVLVEQFYAHDIDEGFNAEVTYKISLIEPIEIDNGQLLNFVNLFSIENYENKYARIIAGTNFKGFSGKWAITIVATDNGDLGNTGPSLSSNATYEIIINPINYNRPKIIFPENASRLRLDFMSTNIGRQLILLNSSRLSSFEAIDDDAGIYGDVTFNIQSENDDHIYFELVKFSKKQCDLHVVRDIEEKVYTVSLIAIDGGGLISERIYLTLAFIDRNSQPYFENQEWKTSFTENVTGLEEIRFIPHAIDVKNEGLTSDDDLFQIYYFIDETYNEDAKLFNLDSVTGELKLNEQLDREEINHHSIRIIATNLETKPDIRFVTDNALLIVSCEVIDVNDNPPTFIKKYYVAAVSDKDERGLKEIIKLEATDPDLNDIITYHIVKDTMKVSNEKELSSVKDTAFELISSTGVLKLNFTVQSTMTGYFEFEVEARDLVDHTDTADVKISIISDSSRVSFIFDNTTNELENIDQDILLGIFSDAFNADCRFDEIIADSEEPNRAILRVHFEKDYEVIDGQIIKDKTFDNVLYDTLINQLKLKLNLVLKGTRDEFLEEEDSNLNLDLILSILVGVLSVALFTMIVIYILQIKRYLRQIKVLSEKKFEPTAESFHNVKAVPNTNLFSEGKQANPVMMNNIENPYKVDADTKSIISTDSDDFANLNDSKIFDINSSVDKNQPSTFV